MRIAIEDPATPDVLELLQEHLANMAAVSPPESCHALDLDELRVPSVTFWAARADVGLVGCGALLEFSDTEGEIKSMRTATTERGKGVATAVLEVIVAEAERRGYGRLSLETGSQPFFAPARRLYRRYGFLECGPFAKYVEDPNTVFMTKML